MFHDTTMFTRNYKRYQPNAVKMVGQCLTRTMSLISRQHLKCYISQYTIIRENANQNKPTDVVRMVGQRSTNSMSYDSMMLPYKDRGQHLPTHKVSRYRPLAPHGGIIMTINLLYLIV